MTSVRFHVLLLVLGASTVMAAPKVCKVEAFGELTTFLGDTYPVEIPCRYRLAEMTCGVYSVKVTVKSDFVPPANKRFSPEAVLVEISNDGNKYVAYTSVNLLNRAVSTGSNPWNVVTSDLAPGFADLEGGKVKVKKGPAVVTFGSDRTVEVTCNSETFTSAPIDQALCGDFATSNELQQWKNTQFGPGHGVSNAQAVHYLVLNNGVIVQSPICQQLADTFQTCPAGSKQLTATRCEPIFGKTSVAGDLGQGDPALLTSYYEGCLKHNCGYCVVSG